MTGDLCRQFNHKIYPFVFVFITSKTTRRCSGGLDLIDSKIKIRAEIHSTGTYESVRGLVLPLISVQFVLELLPFCSLFTDTS